MPIKRNFENVIPLLENDRIFQKLVQRSKIECSLTYIGREFENVVFMPNSKNITYFVLFDFV